MLNDDELSRRLRDALHEMVKDIEPSAGLMKNVDDIPSRERNIRARLARLRHRRLLAAVPIPIAAIVAGIVVFTGTDVAPSFAVTREPGGAVQVTINDLTGVAGANARLRALNIPAVIVPMRASCSTHIDLSSTGVNEHPAPTFKLIPSEIPAGTTIVLGAEQTGSNSVDIAFGRVTGTPPSCVAPDGSGPGLSTSTSLTTTNTTQTRTQGQP